MEKPYKVWLWQTAASELEPGQMALIVEGPGMRDATTIVQQRRLASLIEKALNDLSNHA